MPIRSPAPGVTARLRPIPPVAGALATLVGSLVLAGWLLDVEAFKSVLPGLISMKANTAVAFVLAVTALRLTAGPTPVRRPLALLCAAGGVLISLASLTEYAVGWDLGIDQLLFRDILPSGSTAPPGRMAPVTGVCFVLIGGAVWLVDRATPLRIWLAQAAGLAAGLIASVALIGYLYHVLSLASAGHEVPMALHTAATFGMLGLGVLCIRPEHGFIADLIGAGAGAQLARRLLPAVLAIPIMVVGAQLATVRLDLAGAEATLAAGATITLAILAALAWVSAHSLNRTDRKRSEAEEALRRVNEELEAHVAERTAELRETQAREIAELRQAELRIQAFAELAQRLNVAISPKEAAAIILESADQLLGWESAYLDLYSPDTDRLLPVLNYDVVNGRRPAVAPVPSDDVPGPMSRRVLGEGGQLILRSNPEAASDDADGPALRLFGDTRRRSASLMFVPIRHGAKVTGVLSIQSYRLNAYTRESLNTLQALADHAGGALSRIRTQADLEQSEARLQGLMETAPDAMIIVNASGEVVLVNSQAERLFGYPRDELLGRPIECLIPERFQARHGMHRAEFAHDARVRPMGAGLELFARHRDGREFPVEISLSPLRTAEGLLVSSAIRDITERKRGERRQQAFASLAQRLGAVATPKEAARIILEVADQLLGWDAGYLDTYDVRHDELTSVLNFDVVDGQRAEVAPGVMTMQPGPVTRRAIAEGGQLILRSTASELVAQIAVFGDTTRMSESLLYVPIRHGTQVSGILSIQSYRPNAYTTESLETLQALADHVGSALDRIRAQAELQQSEARQRYLVEHANHLIYETDTGGHITSFNPTAARLLGYSPEELRGRHYLELVHPDQRTRIARVYGRQFVKRIPSTYEEVPVLARDGSVIWLGQNVQLVLDGEHLVGCQVVARDITRRRQAEQALSEANQKLTGWVTELEQRNREISLLRHMGERLQACQTPAEAHDVFSQTLALLFPAMSGALYLLNSSRDRLEAAVRWGETAELVLMFAPDDCWALRRGQPHGLEGDQVALRCQHLGEAPAACPLCVPVTAQNEVLGVLHLRAVCKDPGGPGKEPTPNLEAAQQLALTVVEQMALALSNVKLRETLRSQAIRDPLTGLFNRRYLEETLDRELSRSARSGRPFGVIMLDLDHFKRFNDTFGHPAGDAVLRELGRLLSDHTRGGDIACRYGGEEFTVVLPECPLAVTQRRAEEIRAGARRLAVQYHGQLLGTVTISLGVANYPEHGDSGEALLQLVDAALYRAKAEGRDRVATATA